MSYLQIAIVWFVQHLLICCVDVNASCWCVLFDLDVHQCFELLGSMGSLRRSSYVGIGTRLSTLNDAFCLCAVIYFASDHETTFAGTNSAPILCSIYAKSGQVIMFTTYWCVFTWLSQNIFGKIVVLSSAGPPVVTCAFLEAARGSPAKTT